MKVDTARETSLRPIALQPASVTQAVDVVATANGAVQVSFTTPSGTNKWHGAAYWYNRNNALASNGFFENRDG